jgi:hypothetical protein
MVVGSDVNMVEEELVAAPACGLHILVVGGGVFSPPRPLHVTDKNRYRKIGQDEGNYANTSVHLNIHFSFQLLLTTN